MVDKNNTEATVLGLPEVRSDATQVLDGPVSTAPELPPVAATTAPGLPSLPSAEPVPTAPSLPPVVTPPAPPPRTKTGGVPRTKTAGAVPVASAPRRASRVAVEAPAPEETSPPTRITKREPFEWTLPRVAAVAGGVCLVFILAWVFWPSAPPQRPRPTAATPEPVTVAAPEPAPRPTRPAPTAPTPIAAPAKPTLTLDARTHVIDPFAVHADDLPLEPAHKYRLKLDRDEPKRGVVLARLEEGEGWGVMRKMASHALLQFGGARTLRLHCEPGSHFTAGQAITLELTDLATRKSTTLSVDPAHHCWDFEIARRLDLGEGVKKRVRVPTSEGPTLGPNVPLRVAYVIESLGDTTEWRTGVLNPGQSVLAEGRSVRFAFLDPYAGDNAGTLDLELLEGDTASDGLVTPTASGAQFVPVTK